MCDTSHVSSENDNEKRKKRLYAGGVSSVVAARPIQSMLILRREETRVQTYVKPRAASRHLVRDTRSGFSQGYFMRMELGRNPYSHERIYA